MRKPRAPARGMFFISKITKMITNHNKTQLELVLQRVEIFEQSPLSLSTLLSLTRSLEESIKLLSIDDKEWTDSLISEWWELEFTSSLMMDKETENFTDEDKENLELALQNMKVMIKTYLIEASS